MADYIRISENVLRRWGDMPETLTLLLHLVFLANEKDGWCKGVDVKRGQYMTSQTKLSDVTGLSVKQVRTCVGKLVDAGEITLHPTNKHTIISIVFYDDYQNSEGRARGVQETPIGASVPPYLSTPDNNWGVQGACKGRAKGVQIVPLGGIVNKFLDDADNTRGVQDNLPKRKENKEKATQKEIKENKIPPSISTPKSSSFSPPTMKDIIDAEDEKEKEKLAAKEKENDRFVKDFKDFFNGTMSEADAIIPRVQVIGGQRKQYLLARLREYGKDTVEDVVRKAAVSDFLNGKNSKAWVATFDWMFRPNNFPKVLDGNYDNRTGQNGNDTGQNTRDRRRGFDDIPTSVEEYYNSF